MERNKLFECPSKYSVAFVVHPLGVDRRKGNGED